MFTQDSVAKKLKELGHDRSKREELQGYCTANIQKILKKISYIVLKDDGADLLDCIFLGIPDTLQPLAKHKYTIFMSTLDALQKESTSSIHCRYITSRLCLELQRLQTNNILQIFEHCLQAMKGNTDVNMLWRDIIPECINVLQKRCDMKHNTNDIFHEPKEKITDIVHTLIDTDIEPTQLVVVTSMLIDIQLEKQDINRLLIKICTYINKLNPDSLPPLVHQLLKLSREHDVELILVHLSNYFNVNLYNDLHIKGDDDSESTNFELNDFGYSPKNLTDCLSTCIYHILHSALCDVVKKHLKNWPTYLILRNPFLIHIALSLNELGSDYQNICLGVIKSSIQQQCFDEQRVKESAWLRSLMKQEFNIAKLLKQIVAESANQKELTVSGLISLAISLLTTSPIIGRDQLAVSCWHYGKLILVRLVRTQIETVRPILVAIADKMTGDANLHRQCSETLKILCKAAPLCMADCSNQISNILEKCLMSVNSNSSSSNILKSVSTLITFSFTIRDALVMLCRKGIFSRDINMRCASLRGLLNLLRQMKVIESNVGGASTMCASESSSTHSYLTQISIDLHATHTGQQVSSHINNKTVCMEVLSIMRRVFTQDATAKTILYSEILECVENKPTIFEMTMEYLTEHFLKYIPSVEDTADTTPLLLDKCVQVNEKNVTLIEPLGHLINAIQQFIILSSKCESSEEIAMSQTQLRMNNKIKDILNELCCKFTTHHFLNPDMDTHSELSDANPESKSKMLKLQQCLQCYEALIAFKINEWSVDTVSQSSIVYSLIKSYTQLLDQCKVMKTRKQTKPNESIKQTQKSQKTQQKTDATKVTTNKDVFKPLPCLWNIQICVRICQLLYGETIEWSSKEERSQLRGKRDVHTAVLKYIKSSINDGRHTKHSIVTHCPEIVKILYQRCLMRFTDVCDFHEPTAVACLDTFRECLVLITSSKYSIDVKELFNYITNKTDAPITECLSEILKSLRSVFTYQDDDSDVQEDAIDRTSKQMSTTLVTLIIILYGHITEPPSPELVQELEWIENHIRTSNNDYLFLLPKLLSVNCSYSTECRMLDDILTSLTHKLGKLDDDDETVRTQCDMFPSITNTNASSVCNNVCTIICSNYLRYIDIVNCRLRQMLQSIPYTINTHHCDTQKVIKQWEMETIVRLSSIANWCVILLELRVSVGQTSNKILMFAQRLFTTLATTTKIIYTHYEPRTGESVINRYRMLLQVTGKKLSTAVDNFIAYIESTLTEELKGKHTASRVLRDTKLIPRLVCQVETYYKNVISLSNKCKMNFQQYISHGTARDFRIHTAVLNEALQQQQGDNEENDISIQETSHEDDNMIEDQELSDDASTVVVEQNESDAENEVPKKKKKLSRK